MIDRMIASYRAQIYDWNFKQWISFFRNNKKIFVKSLLCVLIPLSIYIGGLFLHNKFLIGAALVAEILAIVYIDRYSVKNHIASLKNRKQRIDETKDFLNDMFPELNWEDKDIINEVIERLTERIEKTIPLKNFINGITSFAKAIVVPIITYIAGVYSSGLEEMDISIVLTYAVAVIIFIGMIRLFWIGIYDIVRIFFNRNYDAAVALKEDLMDLRLMELNNKKDRN